MAYYHRQKLEDYSTKIMDSYRQLEEYLKDPNMHIINPESLNGLRQNITIVDIPHHMAVLELTGNIVSEMKTILGLEEKRRKSEIQLKVAEEKHAVKKGRIEKRKREKITNPYAYLLRSNSASQALPCSQPESEDKSEPTPSTTCQ